MVIVDVDGWIIHICDENEVNDNDDNEIKKDNVVSKQRGSLWNKNPTYGITSPNLG